MEKIPEGTNVTMGDTMPVPGLGSNFDPPKDRYLTAIYNQWVGKREELIADLQIYLENPVGVGEHPDIGEAIKSKLEQIEKYDSLATSLKNYFLGKPNPQQEAGEAP